MMAFVSEEDKRKVEEALSILQNFSDKAGCSSSNITDNNVCSRQLPIPSTSTPSSSAGQYYISNL